MLSNASTFVYMSGNKLILKCKKSGYFKTLQIKPFFFLFRRNNRIGFPTVVQHVAIQIAICKINIWETLRKDKYVPENCFLLLIDWICNLFALCKRIMDWILASFWIIFTLIHFSNWLVSTCDVYDWLLGVAKTIYCRLRPFCSIRYLV